MKAATCIFIFLKFGMLRGYDIFDQGVNYKYRFEANVTIIPDVEKSEHEETTQWSISGELLVQRIDQLTLAMQINAPVKEEAKSLSQPFKMKSLSKEESSHWLIQHPQKVVELSENEPIWSANIKRGISSLFQVEGNSQSGAYISNEFGLYGLCQTEYYVVNNSDTLLISKIYDMDRCSPFPGGIFEIRSNIPLNLCEEKQPLAHAITSRLGEYKLSKLEGSKYLLKSIKAETKSNVQATESYYPQFIFTNIDIRLESNENILEDQKIAFNSSEKLVLSGFTFVAPKEATGGRSPKSSDEVVNRIIKDLTSLANRLEDVQLNFDEPYMEAVSEIFRLIETMDYATLKKLYDKIDIGTSYIQETSRNIFLEMLPRVGTAASVLLTKHLVTQKLVRPTNAVQLLISLPFFISELSSDLIKECEELLHVGNDRPDVKHSAVLSYATIIYKAFVAGAISADQFEKYVKTFFDLFLNSFEYEQQMLYLEAMGNLQLGNVANYLQPIITADYSQTTDIRFLAIFATLPTAYTRPDEIFETYWPIFYKKTSPLQLRIAAFTMLLVSSPTHGRLLGLYNVVKNENCPHMINFYRTTVLSISETTYSCLSHLKRLILYMRRTLPDAPPKKYWITGNYIFDYKDRKFQLGSMLQALLIGDRRRDMPLIIFLKFDTEALGRFTGQIGIYLKARGLSDAILDRVSSFDLQSLKMDDLLKILALMKLQPIQSTPLHLEFIVQFEGKSVLSFYLSQASFQKLTEGDIINRLNLLLRADSHINMQIVRRPFMIKHKFSTLIGTPADIFIESTLIASIRGSTTQNLVTDKITRNNQIDFRYLSYAVAKIRSYNPVDDQEFSTIREQGFVVYLPLNNEIILNLLDKSATFSLYRKDSLTSGLALKSRATNFFGKKQVASRLNGTPTHELNLEDIGVNILIAHNVESSKENIMFLFEADVLDNAKVFTRTPYSIMQNLLTVVSVIQLTSVHISRDKHLTVLLTNQPNSKIEGVLRWDSEDFSQNADVEEKKVLKVDFSLLHLLDFNDPHPKQLHKWEFTSKYSTLKNSRASKAVMSLNRKAIDGDKWKLCVSGTFEDSENLRQPFRLTSNIVFGSLNSSRNCPTDKSRIDLTLAIGPPDDALERYENLTVADTDTCTKEIVKFSPVLISEQCKSSQFSDILAITDFNLNIGFERMPETFYDYASRLDHVLSAALPGKIEKLNISQYFDLSVKISLPTAEGETTKVSINDVETSVPLSYELSYGNLDQLSVEYGFTSLCSLYKDKLNSLGQKSFVVNDKLKRDHSLNNEVLLVAECSDKPRVAIFVTYKNSSNDFEEVKIYSAGHFFTMKADNEASIFFEGKQLNISGSPFEHPQFGSDFRVTLKGDGVVEVQNFLIDCKIQYNMKNLISVSMPTVKKGKLCGLCKVV